MAAVSLTQLESELLLNMEKLVIDPRPINFPDLGGTLEILLHCSNKREEFVLNYTRAFISLSKRNHHLRGLKIVGLARLDLDGPPHRNPDGIEIGPRHLHLYREGYGLKYAFEIPNGVFSKLDDAFQTLQDFLKYCNVIEMPNILKGLFT